MKSPFSREKSKMLKVLEISNLSLRKPKIENNNLTRKLSKSNKTKNPFKNNSNK